MISVKQKGNLSNTIHILNVMKDFKIDPILNTYGKKGCDALEEATPKRTGKTSRSWYYTIEKKDGDIRLVWKNSNIQNGRNIALLIQYGFVTKTGYRVAPRDYINPALEPIYKELVEAVEGEVKRL